MTQPDELKPCPFCGGAAIVNADGWAESSWWFAQCLGCQAQGDEYNSGEEALKAWNTRSTPDQQAIDHVMAHNAILREALWKYANCGPFDFQPSDAEEILNATEADVEAWLKAFAKKSVEDLLGVWPYADVCKQLATVTNERDALQEALKISTGTVESLTTATEALAQKGSK